MWCFAYIVYLGLCVKFQHIYHVLVSYCVEHNDIDVLYCTYSYTRACTCITRLQYKQHNLTERFYGPRVIFTETERSHVGIGHPLKRRKYFFNHQ